MEEESRVQPYRRPAAGDAIDDAELEVNHRPIEDYEAIPLNTLDYGVTKTLGLELKDMLYKFSYVLIPRPSSGTKKLRNWDLWGPFFMCLIFGFFINSNTFLIQIPRSSSS